MSEFRKLDNLNKKLDVATQQQKITSLHKFTSDLYAGNLKLTQAPEPHQKISQNEQVLNKPEVNVKQPEPLKEAVQNKTNVSDDTVLYNGITVGMMKTYKQVMVGTFNQLSLPLVNDNSLNGQPIAIRDDYLNRSELNEYLNPKNQKAIETPKPDEQQEHRNSGETLLNFSQHQKVKEAISLSPSFKQTLDDLSNCKWSKDIRIWQGQKKDNTDYRADYNLIELNSSDGIRRQIQVFAHEGYHASHQDLAKLYGKNETIKPNNFVNIKMRLEAGAFLREIKTNEELRISHPKPFNNQDNPNQRVEYEYVNKNNPKEPPKVQNMNNLLIYQHGQLNEEASLNSIENFLRNHPAPKKNNSGEYVKNSNGEYDVDDYVKQYGVDFKKYQTNFGVNRKNCQKNGYI